MTRKIFISFCVLFLLITPIYSKTLYKTKNINDYIQLIKISGTYDIKVKVKTKGQTNVNKFYEDMHIGNGKVAIFNSCIIPNRDGTFESIDNCQGKERKCTRFNPDKRIWDCLVKEDFVITVYSKYYDEKEEQELINQYYEGYEISFITPLKIEYRFENDELTKYIYSLEKKSTKEQSVYYSKDKIIIDYLIVKKIKVPTDNIVNFEEVIINSENNRKRKQLKDEFDSEEEAKKLEKEKKKNLKLRKIVENPDSCKLTFENEDEIFEATEYYPYYGALLVEFHNNEWISCRAQIIQKLGNRQFLFTLLYKKNIFLGELKKCCRKDNFYEGQWVDVAALINGTYTYKTVLYGMKTIPKVNVYAIRPSVAMQNR